MKNEQEMLDFFQVEELEKRYEMGWVRVVASGENSPTGVDLTTGEIVPNSEAPFPDDF